MDERTAARHEDLLSELKSSPEHAERARFSAAGGEDGSDVRLLKLLPFLAKTQWPFAAAFGEALAGAMQGKELDGRALRLEISSGGGGGGDDDDKDKDKVPKGTSATKIVVRNVAFEATKRDVQKLFNPFGTLKSCRLPKKFDGSHRGFAFVELSTKREASAALEALAGTHLYGRRLVIERAALEDDVETVREKTARRFAESAAASSGAPTRKKPKTGKAY